MMKQAMIATTAICAAMVFGPGITLADDIPAPSFTLTDLNANSTSFNQLVSPVPGHVNLIYFGHDN